MGITYQIDHDQHIVFTFLDGTVTDADLAPYAEGVWRNLRGAVFDGLVDARGVERVLITSHGMRQIAELSVRLNLTHDNYRVAIVAARDVVYGMGRMLEVYREGTPGAVQVFRTMEEAMAWLRLAPDAAREVG
jgi:hypothetical protein